MHADSEASLKQLHEGGAGGTPQGLGDGGGYDLGHPHKAVWEAAHRQTSPGGTVGRRGLRLSPKLILETEIHIRASAVFSFKESTLVILKTYGPPGSLLHVVFKTTL